MYVYTNNKLLLFGNTVYVGWLSLLICYFRKIYDLHPTECSMNPSKGVQNDLSTEHIHTN